VSIKVGQAVKWAVEAGIRLIDTAYFYFNEEEIGQALTEIFKEGKVKREDLFIVTKLPHFAVRPKDIRRHFEESRRMLGLDYIDLYLIHFPNAMVLKEGQRGQDLDWGKEVIWDKTTDLVKCWKEMEKLVDDGLAKAIGLSNSNSEQLERVSKNARIPVAVNQVECHAYFQQKKLWQSMNKLGIRLMAYSPLGSPGNCSYLDTCPHC